MHVTNITKLGQTFVYCPVSLQLAYLAICLASVHLPLFFYCMLHISQHMCTYLSTCMLMSVLCWLSKTPVDGNQACPSETVVTVQLYYTDPLLINHIFQFPSE